MKIKCVKIISPITKEDLGESGAGLTKGRVYTVLVFDVLKEGKARVLIVNDDNESVGVYDLSLFEVVNNSISVYWKYYETGVGYSFCPEAWSSDDFWERLDDNYYDAIDTFEELVEKINSE